MEKPSSILVVDDHESNRDVLRRRLERDGYQVSVAIGGQQALIQVQENVYDLIILDIMMPGINGLEVLDILRKTHTSMQLPIIMATALDQSKDVVSALERGANDYVIKPLDFSVVAARVRTHLRLKQSIDRIVALEADLQTRNDELTAKAARTALELTTAARVQQAFLPQADPKIAGAKFSWLFEPCTEMAGDSLNIVQLDDENVALYVLDVSGHGVAASLLAVTATRLLSPSGKGDSFVFQNNADGSRRISDPCEVATRLTQNFSIDATEQFITLFYAIYNTVSRELRYVSAGHPGAIRISQGLPPAMLNGTGMPIGIGEVYEQQSVQLNATDRLYLYSDGVTETMDSSRSMFGTERLLASLDRGASEPLGQSISQLRSDVTAWRQESASRDDISILGMECV